MKVGGHFYKADQYGISQRFDFSASVTNAKAIWYNSGDARGFHSAKKKPHATLKMTAVETIPAGQTCENSVTTWTIGFSGPVHAGFDGALTAAKQKGRGFRVSDRKFAIGFSARVNLHYQEIKVDDPWECTTKVTEDDQLVWVEIGATATLDRNNRTAHVTKVDSWGPLSVLSFPIPDEELPTGSGTIRFDRDVTDAA
jgi:hypothetical protein